MLYSTAPNPPAPSPLRQLSLPVQMLLRYGTCTPYSDRALDGASELAHHWHASQPCSDRTPTPARPNQPVSTLRIRSITHALELAHRSGPGGNSGDLPPGPRRACQIHGRSRQLRLGAGADNRVARRPRPCSRAVGGSVRSGAAFRRQPSTHAHQAESPIVR